MPVRPGKRSYAALIPDNPYGTVVEAAFKQAVARRNGPDRRARALSARQGRHGGAVRNIAQASVRADACSSPMAAMRCRTWSRALVADAVNPKRLQLLGTGLWDDPRIYATPALDGGWYAAPDGAGYRNFAARYRKRYNQDPVRTATLAYDAVALIAALVKTQGPQPFSPQVLTNPSGFSGIDGLFRFRADGTNERGLAVLRVEASGAQIISPAPRSFGSSARQDSKLAYELSGLERRPRSQQANASAAIGA